MALFEYLEVLKTMDFKIQVISPSNGTFVEQLKENGYEVLIVPFYSWTRKLEEPFINRGIFRRTFRNLLAVIQVVKNTRGIHAVCTNTICVHIGQLAAIFSGKPHYLFVHEFGEEDHGFKLGLPTQWAYRLSSYFSKGIILNSVAIKAKWRSFVGDSNKLKLLYNIVQVNGLPEKINRKSSKKTEIKNRFLMLGQISPAKGHFDAIESVFKIRQEDGDIGLDIIGNVPNEDYFHSLNSYIKSLGSEGYVKILPPVSNPFLIFPEYKALLMCSRQEAFGRVSVEALKAGLPVIGRNTGGTREIVKDGVNGFLYNDGEPYSLAESLKAFLLLDDEKYEQLRHNAKLTCKKFNTKMAQEQLSQVFQL